MLHILAVVQLQRSSLDTLKTVWKMAATEVNATLPNIGETSRHEDTPSTTSQLSGTDQTAAPSSWNDAVSPSTGATTQPQQTVNKNGNNTSNQAPSGTDQTRPANDDRQDQDQGTVAQPGWLRRITEKYGTLVLDNKGSTARDHLALGRFPPFPPRLMPSLECKTSRRQLCGLWLTIG